MRVFDVGEHKMVADVSRDTYTHEHLRVCADKKQTHHNRPELPETSLLWSCESRRRSEISFLLNPNHPNVLIVFETRMPLL
jgi:hypothetical protein